MPARALLERLYGFAESATTPAGEPASACLFCDAPATPGDSPGAHAADCPCWEVRAAFASAVGRRLVAGLAGGAP